MGEAAAPSEDPSTASAVAGARATLSIDISISVGAGLSKIEVLLARVVLAEALAHAIEVGLEIKGGIRPGFNVGPRVQLVL